MKTKTIGTFLIAGLILLSALVVFATPAMAGNEFSACFDYKLGTYNETVGYTWVADLHPKKTICDAGDIEIYDNGTYLFIRTTVYPHVKPWLAWGEKDKDNDGVVELSELGSDGEKVEINKEKDWKVKYEWKVDGQKALEIEVPSYTEDGIHNETIVYIATIPVPANYDKNICIKVHASPNCAPYVVSSDVDGFETNVFYLSDSVYCYAGEIKQEQEDPKTVDIYVVKAKDDWELGDALDDDVYSTTTDVEPDKKNIDVTKIWSPPLVVGDYDIVVDVNQNGSLDACEPIDGWTSTGIVVTPEFSTIAIPVASILGLLFFFNHRKRRKAK